MPLPLAVLPLAAVAAGAAKRVVSGSNVDGDNDHDDNDSAGESGGEHNNNGINSDNNGQDGSKEKGGGEENEGEYTDDEHDSDSEYTYETVTDDEEDDNKNKREGSWFGFLGGGSKRKQDEEMTKGGANSDDDCEEEDIVAAFDNHQRNLQESMDNKDDGSTSSSEDEHAKHHLLKSPTQDITTKTKSSEKAEEEEEKETILMAQAIQRVQQRIQNNGGNLYDALSEGDRKLVDELKGIQDEEVIQQAVINSLEASLVDTDKKERKVATSSQEGENHHQNNLTIDTIATNKKVSEEETTPKVSEIIHAHVHNKATDDAAADGESEVGNGDNVVSSIKIDASNMAQHETKSAKPLHKPISIGRRKISDIMNKELSDNESSDEDDDDDDESSHDAFLLLGSYEILISDDIHNGKSEALAQRSAKQQKKSSSFKGKVSIAKKNCYGLYSAENSEENEGNSEESSEGRMSNDLLSPSASDVVSNRARDEELSCNEKVAKRDELISTSDEEDKRGSAKAVHGKRGKKRKVSHGKEKGRVSLERRVGRQSYHEHCSSSEEEEKDSEEDGGNSSDEGMMSSDELISSNEEEEGHDSKLGASTANAISRKSQQSQGNTLITSSDAIGSSINKSILEDDPGHWHSRRSESEVVLSRIRRKHQRSLLKSRRRIRTNAHATVNSPDTPNNNRTAGGSNGGGVQQQQQQQLRRTTLRFAAAPVAVNKRKKQMTLKSLFKKG